METKQMLVVESELDGNLFGKALRVGALTATVFSKESGKYVTVSMACRRKKRDGESGRGNWLPCGFGEAERVFIGPYADSIGAWTLTGKFAGTIISPFGQSHFDEKRIWAAVKLIEVCAGRAPIETDQYVVQAAETCMICSRELTQPESIDRGIGPECWSKVTGLSAPAPVTEHERPEGRSGTIMQAVDSTLDDLRSKMPKDKDPAQMSILQPGQAAQSALTYDSDPDMSRAVAPRPNRDAYLGNRRDKVELGRIRCKVCGYERDKFNGWAYSGPCTDAELPPDTTDYVNHEFEEVPDGSDG